MPEITLITAAVSEELEPARAVLSGREGIVFSPLGVGSTEAAIGTFEAVVDIRECRPGGDISLIFIGSAGSTDRAMPLLSLVSATGVLFADLGSASGRAEIPERQSREYAADEGLFSRIEDALGGGCFYEGVYSTPSLTRSNDDARLLSSCVGARVENLELFGVAKAAERLRVSWACISVISNYTDEHGHRDWLKNRDLAARKSAEALLRVLTVPNN